MVDHLRRGQSLRAGSAISWIRRIARANFANNTVSDSHRQSTHKAIRQPANGGNSNISAHAGHLTPPQDYTDIWSGKTGHSGTRNRGDSFWLKPPPNPSCYSHEVEPAACPGSVTRNAKPPGSYASVINLSTCTRLVLRGKAPLGV